jgi:hydrogenase 3 maturation protease
MARIVVCGIGNRLRGDDAVGPMVIDEIGEQFIDRINNDIMLVDCGSVPEGFAKNIISFRPDKIVIIDAVEMNRPPGEVADIPIEKIKQQLATTHKMPITLFIDYLQRSLPKSEIEFIGIQKANTMFGAGMSDECKAAIGKTTSKIEKYFKI